MGRVFVAGSINMDVVATAERHPQIGETVAGKAVLYFPGGKGANQAVAAAKLGAPTTLIGRLGTDAFGQELRAFLAAQGVDLDLRQGNGRSAHRNGDHHLANADNTIVVVPGANALVSADDVAAPVLPRGDIAVSQFEIPLPTIAAFFKRARAAGATTILNPAPAIEFGRELLDLVDILILNETELGLLGEDRASRQRRSRALHRGGASAADGTDKIICVTLGRRGVLALVDGRPHIDSGRAVKAVDTTGAGDCFVGAVAAQLADGNRFATRSTTPTSRRRFACNEWAPRRRCRRRGVTSPRVSREGRDQSHTIEKTSALKRDDTRMGPGFAGTTSTKPARSSDRSCDPPPAPARSSGSAKQPPAEHVIAGAVDRLDADELSGFVAERRERSLPAVAAHHDAIIAGGQARDLKLVGALVAPEPWQAVIGLGVAGQPRRHAARMIGGVLHGLQPQRAAEARACKQRAVADRRDIGIGGQQMLVDDDAGCDRQTGFGRQFDIGQHADADHHEIRRRYAGRR